MSDFLRTKSDVVPDPHHRHSLADADRATPPTSDAPVALEVVSPDLPADPLTARAAGLYTQWVELAKVLYTPASEPPQGVFNRVGPLLQESSDFLRRVMTFWRSIWRAPSRRGDLAAHVARTVLMTLTGAEEAAFLPNIGCHGASGPISRFGRSSASSTGPEDVGLGCRAALSQRSTPDPGASSGAAVDGGGILIGMDEFKLETWQNVANGKNLEPLSKVLRELTASKR